MVHIIGIEVLKLGVLQLLQVVFNLLGGFESLTFHLVHQVDRVVERVTDFVPLMLGSLVKLGLDVFWELDEDRE